MKLRTRSPISDQFLINCAILVQIHLSIQEIWCIEDILDDRVVVPKYTVQEIRSKFELKVHRTFTDISTQIQKT